MRQFSHRHNRGASLRVERAAYHLNSAGQHHAAFTRFARNRHHQQRLRHFLVDLRELSLPLAGLGVAASLELGRQQC